MVFIQEQYVFMHTAIFEALMCGNTEIPATDFTSAMRKLSAVVPQEKKTGYELEFMVG